MKQPFDLFQGTKRYIASAELRDAVNVAVALARPLLVRGEPGTGKTLLASTTRLPACTIRASATRTCATSASTSAWGRWARRSAPRRASCC
jgi:predicted ATPase with chaperone activity